MEKYMVNYDETKDLPLLEREDFARNSAKILIGKGSIVSPGCLFRATFQPGGFHATHIHTQCDEFVYIISGQGLKAVGDEVYELRAGSAYYLPKGVPHWMLNTHPTEPIQVVGFYPDSPDFDGTGYEYLGPIPENIMKEIKK
jgi:oxalate decarboxylase/phosphoglucose isomerase-like protein (cupin superfamily)